LIIKSVFENLIITLMVNFDEVGIRTANSGDLVLKG